MYLPLSLCYWGLKWENNPVHSTIPRVLNSNLVPYFPVGILRLRNAHHKGDETFMHAIWFKPQVINKAAIGSLESVVGTCPPGAVFFQEFEPWVEYNKDRK